MNQSLVDDVIAYHGPKLVDALHDEQANVKLPSFLTATNLARKSSDLPKDESFETKLCRFIGRKADMLFEKKGLPRTMKITNEQEANEQVSVLPPLESFMSLDPDFRRQHLFSSLKSGDIMVGQIFAMQESGLTIRLLCLDGGKSRDIEDLQLSGFCSTRDVPRLFAHEAPLNGYEIKDYVRGVVLAVQTSKEVILLSMRSADWPAEYDDVKLGLLNEEDLPLAYVTSQRLIGKSYHDCLTQSRAWSNDKSVDILTASLGLNNIVPPPSLTRRLKNARFPPEEFADSLRKTQSYRWALKSVAEGIRYFKDGKYPEAMQYLNKALQIDEDNVEALVARGALYANTESYSRAIQDFEAALKLRPRHTNALKYMIETLIVQARSLLDDDRESDAIPLLERVLDLDPANEEARKLLRDLQNKPQPPPNYKADTPASPASPAAAASPRQQVALKETADKLRSLIELEAGGSNKRLKSKQKKRKSSSNSSSSRQSSSSSSSSASSRSSSSSSDSSNASSHRKSANKKAKRQTQRSGDAASKRAVARDKSSDRVTRRDFQDGDRIRTVERDSDVKKRDTGWINEEAAGKRGASSAASKTNLDESVSMRRLDGRRNRSPSPTSSSLSRVDDKLARNSKKTGDSNGVAESKATAGTGDYRRTERRREDRNRASSSSPSSSPRRRSSGKALPKQYADFARGSPRRKSTDSSKSRQRSSHQARSRHRHEGRSRSRHRSKSHQRTRSRERSGSRKRSKSRDSTRRRSGKRSWSKSDKRSMSRDAGDAGSNPFVSRYHRRHHSFNDRRRSDVGRRRSLSSSRRRRSEYNSDRRQSPDRRRRYSSRYDQRDRSRSRSRSRRRSRSLSSSSRRERRRFRSSRSRSRSVDRRRADERRMRRSRSRESDSSDVVRRNISIRPRRDSSPSAKPRDMERVAQMPDILAQVYEKNLSVPRLRSKWDDSDAENSPQVVQTNVTTQAEVAEKSTTPEKILMKTMSLSDVLKFSEKKRRFDDAQQSAKGRSRSKHKDRSKTKSKRVQGSRSLSKSPPSRSMSPDGSKRPEATKVQNEMKPGVYEPGEIASSPEPRKTKPKPAAVADSSKKRKRKSNESSNSSSDDASSSSASDDNRTTTSRRRKKSSKQRRRRKSKSKKAKSKSKREKSSPKPAIKKSRRSMIEQNNTIAADSESTAVTKHKQQLKRNSLPSMSSMSSSAAVSATETTPTVSRDDMVKQRAKQEKQRKEANELAEMEGFLSMLKQKSKGDVKEATDKKKVAPDRPKLW